MHGTVIIKSKNKIYRKSPCLLCKIRQGLLFIQVNIMKSNVIPVLFVFVAGWVFFFFFYPYHLFFKEQLILFVGGDWLSYFQKPAFPVEIAGDYLTQFYLLIGGGPTILMLVLAGAWLGLRMALKRVGVDRNAGLWALLPVVMEGSLSCQLEYPLSMIIGLILVALTFVLLTFIQNKILFRITGMVAVVALYLLAGAHFITFSLLIILHEIRHKRAFIYSLGVVLLTLATPVIASRYYLLTYTQAYYYPIIDRYLLEMPFLFLLTEAALLAAFFFVYYRCKRQIAFIVLVVTAPLSVYCMSDFQEESNLAFSCEAYFGHWKKVIQLSKANKYPTYLSAYYTNLAYAKAGQLPNHLLDYNQPGEYGLFLESKSTTSYIYEMASPDALMECNDMAQAQHSAMLAMLFTPHQRSSSMVRKLAGIAIANGEYPTAEKYLSMLSKTTLHRRWANENRQLIANDTAMFTFFGKRAFLSQRDTLFFTNDWRASLVNLLQSNPQNKTAIDYLLCYHLLRKDLKLFKADYDAYYYPTFGPVAPELYQQALLIGMDESDEQQYAAELRKYGIDREIWSRSREFLSLLEKAQRNEEKIRAAFSTSYWFYYFYAQMK
jgi:hypothetical protein